jgi:cytochrome c oxidase subunit IV
MQQRDEKQYLFDKPENVNRLLRGFYILCGILFALDFVVHRHVSLDWERLPGFYAIFGFVACVLLVLIAKEMRKVLMRKEDYYDVDE